MSKDGLLPKGRLSGIILSEDILIASGISGNDFISFIITHTAYNGGVPSVMLVTFQSSNSSACITSLIGSINVSLKYKRLSDNSVNIYLEKGSYAGRTALFCLAGDGHMRFTSVNRDEIDSTCVSFTNQ